MFNTPNVVDTPMSNFVYIPLLNVAGFYVIFQNSTNLNQDEEDLLNKINYLLSISYEQFLNVRYTYFYIKILY